MKLPWLALGMISALTLGMASVQAADFGADRHVARGMNCETCHGKDNAIEYPTIEQCTGCHNPDAVEKATEGKYSQNPHRSPHYGNTMDCVLCHVQHGETQDACGSCHTFGYKVP